MASVSLLLWIAPHLHTSDASSPCMGSVMSDVPLLCPAACNEFLSNWPKFDFKEDEVPQLEDMSRILK